MGIDPETGKPDRAITPDDVPIESSGAREIDTLANLINGIGDAAIDLWERLSLEEIDGLVHVLNQYRTSPDDRLNDYLQRCAEQWQKDNEAKRLAALGIGEGVTVVERV